MRSKNYSIRLILTQSTSSNLVYLSFVLCVPSIRSRVSFVHKNIIIFVFLLDMKQMSKTACADLLNLHRNLKYGKLIIAIMCKRNFSQ